jgi:uncharacterized damage-inducible protein DinB
MYHNAAEFLDMYGWEAECTGRVLGALTDESLDHHKATANSHRPLGNLAWHVATAPSYVLAQIELPMPEYEHEIPDGTTLARIQTIHADQVEHVKANVAKLTPEDLKKVYHVFDRMDWPAWQLLAGLIAHEIHHRGQMTVLMRQAGLTVPNIYGPNLEETREMMAQMQQQ